jgi:hypothetical protein
MPAVRVRLTETSPTVTATATIPKGRKNRDLYEFLLRALHNNGESDDMIFGFAGHG